MANSNQVTAINEERIDNCILELSNYLERLKTVFIRLDDAVFSTTDFYESSNGDEYRRKYSLLHDNYAIIIANVSSYIDELRAVKTNYNVFSEELSSRITIGATSLGSDYTRHQG